MRVMLYDTNPGAIVSAKQFIEDMVNKRYKEKYKTG
jgi:hypothetical protein